MVNFEHVIAAWNILANESALKSSFGSQDI